MNARSEDLLALLQLPRSFQDNKETSSASLCLLVVADMDLPSASALAEAALLDLPKGGTLVDGICACGPFCNDQSLSKYLVVHPPQLHHPDDEPFTTTSTLQQKQRRQPQSSAVRNTTNQQQQRLLNNDNHSSPELTLAREGIVTGCLSQLESIVCRVAWIPNAVQDPRTLLHRPTRKQRQQQQEYRLTPNSRNIHQRLLPLAPGLACCGLALSTTTTTTTTTTKDESKTTIIGDTDLTSITKLLDLVAPIEEQIRDLPLKSSVTIVATTGNTIAAVDEDADSASAAVVPIDDDRILLHIDAGRDVTSTTSPTPCLKGKVLYPGSLIHRGEYCLVHLAVVPTNDEDQDRTPSTTTTPRSYHWIVEKVDFRTMEHR